MATMVIKGLGPLLYEEKLERAGTAQPRKEKARGDLMNICKYLKGGCTKGGARRFPAMLSSERKMGTTEIQEVLPECQEMLFE